jgi:hypothetical protein
MEKVLVKVVKWIPLDLLETLNVTLTNTIEIRIENISQLFHSLDPFPFREKDLDKDAEEFIVSWARELPQNQPIRIVVHLPSMEALKPEAQELSHALTRYFAYRAHIVTYELKELFRIGRQALMIGLAVLAFCVILSQTAAHRLTPTPFARLIEESLIILGWVANWRPLEIFLYDWWPLVRQRNLYQRLSNARVELMTFA